MDMGIDCSINNISRLDNSVWCDLYNNKNNMVDI